MENLSAMALSFVFHYVIVTATCGWVLERKGQSQWLLFFLIFGSPIGIIACMLKKNNREEISLKPHAASTRFSHLTAAETRNATAYDKAIERNKGKTWKPIVAGILDIVSAILACLFALWGFYVFIMVVDLEALIIGITYISIATLALIGGVFTLKRKNWGLVLAASITVCAGSIYLLIQISKSLFESPAIFAWLGIPAFILIAFSKHEFKQQKAWRVLEHQKEH
jgi:hypothetical protein